MEVDREQKGTVPSKVARRIAHDRVRVADVIEDVDTHDETRHPDELGDELLGWHRRDHVGVTEVGLCDRLAEPISERFDDGDPGFVEISTPQARAGTDVDRDLAAVRFRGEAPPVEQGGGLLHEIRRLTPLVAVMEPQFAQLCHESPTLGRPGH